MHPYQIQFSLPTLRRGNIAGSPTFVTKAQASGSQIPGVNDLLKVTRAALRPESRSLGSCANIFSLPLTSLVT